MPSNAITRGKALALGVGTFAALARIALRTSEVIHMLNWALTFFVLALVAAFLGFFALAGLAAEIAKLLLLAFVVLLLISMLSGALRGRTPPI